MATGLEPVIVGAGIASATLIATNTIINHSSRLYYWFKRLRGFGSYKIMIGPFTPPQHINHILAYMDAITRRDRIRHVEQVCRKTDSELRTFLIPTQPFYMEDRRGNHIYVKPLITSGLEIAGWEFWTWGWLYGTHKQFQQMLEFLHDVQGGDAESSKPQELTSLKSG